MEVFSKPIVGTVDPLVLTLWRFVCGTAVIAAALAFRGKKPGLNARSLALLALMGLLNTFLSMSLLQLAVKHTTASRAAAVFCSNPVFVVVLASLFGWEKLTGRRVLGLFLGVSGLVLVTGVHRMTMDIGTIYALLASLAFAFYILLGRRVSLKIDPLTVNVVSFAFGIAGLFLWLVLRGKSISPMPLLEHLPSFLYLGIGISGLGYVTFINTIRKMGAGSASTVFLLKPAVTAVLAVTLIKETLTLPFVIGLLLTGVGSYMIAGRHKKSI
jgi:drug/metabolite transporter (DMT)-like permease